MKCVGLVITQGLQGPTTWATDSAWGPGTCILQAPLGGFDKDNILRTRERHNVATLSAGGGNSMPQGCGRGWRTCYTVGARHSRSCCSSCCCCHRNTGTQLPLSCPLSISLQTRPPVTSAIQGPPSRPGRSESESEPGRTERATHQALIPKGLPLPPSPPQPLPASPHPQRRMRKKPTATIRMKGVCGT